MNFDIFHVQMASAALPEIFYYDDPQDGVSAHLLTSIGVKVMRSIGTAQAAASANSLLVDEETSKLHKNGGLNLNREHRYAYGCGIFAPDRPLVVDVRDTADAWIRIYLRTGDAVTLETGVHHRVGTNNDALQPVKVPFESNDFDDTRSRVTTKKYASPILSATSSAGTAIILVPSGCSGSECVYRFPNAEDELCMDVNHWHVPGNHPHTRELVVELCASFYQLGWVTGTGGSISIRHGDRIFMAPSGVQKERMQPQDIFVLDTSGREIYSPLPIPGKSRLKLSQCAPLFQHAFNLRGAGACIHTHDMNAVMCTLAAGDATEFVITHQEMIKGITGHGFLDSCVVPIIENTPHECDLADSLGEAMRRYPKSNAVLVRRHGVYVWGATWEAAKTQAECYHYLFEVAVRMRGIGLDPGAVPHRVQHGIGADKSYGSGKENYAAGAAAGVGHVHNGSCCGGAPTVEAAGSGAGALAAGFHGAQGTNVMQVDDSTLRALSSSSALPALSSYSHVLLDIEGCTTSISFVLDTLFPYAATHAKAWLGAHWGSAECIADVRELVKQSQADVSAAVQGAAAVALHEDSVLSACTPGAGDAAKQAAIEKLLANIAWQMQGNKKTTGLKQLQGHIWRDGYISGALQGHMFSDTVPALQAWVRAGKKVYIYSSGSREAQRLLFQYSVAGDMRSLLSGYFDTTSGPKVEPASYSNIALSLGVDAPASVLFATDSMAEAVAAAQAGMRVVLTDRPGNAPLQTGHSFPVVTTLAALAH